MLVLTVALAAGLIAGYARGGRIRNLDSLDLRLAWLVLVAIAVQLVVFSPLGERLGDQVVIATHLASYGLLLLFVAVNLRQLGVAVAGLGILLNTLAIAANGGYMPASTRALEIAGLAGAETVHNNSAVADAGSRLLPLGDVFAIPSSVPVLANVFSMGDLLIAAGVALLLATAMSPAHVPQAAR